MIVEVNKVFKSGVGEDFIISVLRQAIGRIKGKKTGDNFTLSVAIVDDRTIRNLNRKYRKINRATDVLSFSDPAEIVISWPRVIEQAAEQEHSRKKELVFLLVHGLLHILGYDHERKKQQTAMEKEFQRIIPFLKRKKLLK